MNGAVEGYDYIVVGAGSAGCILANRLSEDASCRVLLLEAGGSDDDVRIKVPVATRALWFDPALNWGYASEPESHCDSRRIPIPRGKLLGGSSSINGLFYVRGHPRDYDHWRQLGCDGWSFDDVLPYFKRLETHWNAKSPFHGDAGPLSIVRCVSVPHLVAPFLEAARRAGFGVSSDQNGAEPEGFATPDLTVSRGRRASSATAFLRPASRRSNLTVATQALCTRLIFERGRVTGVEYLRRGQPHRAVADCEVVVSAGALNSPHLLMISGIGPADDLRAAGVQPRVDLPGVGRNLQDHPSVGTDIAMSRPVGFDRELRMDRFALSLVRWAVLGNGPAATMPVVANGLIRTRSELERPDLQVMVVSASPFAHLWFPGYRAPKGHMFVTRNVLLHPESRGTVTLASADPLAKPRIQFNLLASQADRVALRESIRLTRALFATKPLADYCAQEITPGSETTTDDAIDAYVRRTVGTVFHPAGTCAMGASDTAVVDSRLKVRGVEGLRVVDASVMPALTGGNINAPTMMIAERASDLIRGIA